MWNEFLGDILDKALELGAIQSWRQTPFGWLVVPWWAEDGESVELNKRQVLMMRNTKHLSELLAHEKELAKRVKAGEPLYG